ncbi:alpha-ketoglutarate-dependent dioxygenase AlkB family protein [Enteractinococcus helveticum]|uniref:DNA repair protein n=1 Tax=Enteractinococcus helveticum TaxID=1837282 RepID=A0A1B7LYW7_9MICC|nr:alpha-ketoglutarate-dependent dioxygenase AlkB [Enteractinococcus helveticum]OAV60588.1 DNA repair protein [Enteractinococcus helveticum]
MNTLFGDDVLHRPTPQLPDGAHYVPHWLTLEQQRWLVARFHEFPDWMVRLGRSALVAATGDPSAGDDYTPDAALVNYYDDAARMGMHQDKDEHSTAPVISLSIGDTCLFRFGNTQTRNKPYQDIALASGDLFVFGGPSRMAYHGIPKIYPGTAPQGCGLEAGRINITMRVTGLNG